MGDLAEGRTYASDHALQRELEDAPVEIAGNLYEAMVREDCDIGIKAFRRFRRA